MTAVYLRSEHWAEGAFLADVPFDKLDTVIPTLRGWGIADDEDSDLTGQFVYDAAEPRRAYFEVVISDAEVQS